MSEIVTAGTHTSVSVRPWDFNEPKASGFPEFCRLGGECYYNKTYHPNDKKYGLKSESG